MESPLLEASSDSSQLFSDSDFLSLSPSVSQFDLPYQGETNSIYPKADYDNSEIPNTQNEDSSSPGSEILPRESKASKQPETSE